MRKRRKQLGLTQKEVWRRGGPSNSTQTELESGGAGVVTPSTLGKVDHGLGWKPGTAATVLHTGVAPAVTPTPAEPTDSTGLSPQEGLIAALRDIRDAADRAIRAVQGTDLGVVSDVDLAREFLRRFPDGEALQARLRA